MNIIHSIITVIHFCTQSTTVEREKKSQYLCFSTFESFHLTTGLSKIEKHCYQSLGKVFLLYFAGQYEICESQWKHVS